MKGLMKTNPGEYRAAGEATSFDWEKRTARVPFCRIMPEYREAFNQGTYETAEMPDHVYAKFQKTV